MEKELTPTPHKEKMCDGSGKLPGLFEFDQKQPEKGLTPIPCPGCPACSPEKEKREGAGKDVCDPKNGNCAHCGNLGLANRICDNKCGCHPTPRPSPEAKKNPYDRWEKGVPHFPLSEAVYEVIEKMDFENGDSFCWKSGGDGDNGENLMYLLDEMLDTPGNPIALALDHAKAEERESQQKWLREQIEQVLVLIDCAEEAPMRSKKEYTQFVRDDVKRLLTSRLIEPLNNALSLARKEDGK